MHLSKKDINVIDIFSMAENWSNPADVNRFRSYTGNIFTPSINIDPTREREKEFAKLLFIFTLQSLFPLKQ